MINTNKHNREEREEEGRRMREKYNNIKKKM